LELHHLGLENLHVAFVTGMTHLDKSRCRGTHRLEGRTVHGDLHVHLRAKGMDLRLSDGRRWQRLREKPMPDVLDHDAALIGLMELLRSNVVIVAWRKQWSRGRNR